MNNLLKLKNSQRQINILRMFGTQSLRLCAIALIAVIGFSFAACENGTASNDDNDDSSNNPKSKNVTITIQNNTDDVYNYEPGDRNYKITGVKISAIDRFDDAVKTYKIGDADTFDTAYTAEAGASITTLPAVKITESKNPVVGNYLYPEIFLEVSAEKEGITSTTWLRQYPDGDTTSDETYNLELYQILGGSSAGLHLRDVE